MDDKTTSFNSNATENGRERKKAASTPLPPRTGANISQTPANGLPATNPSAAS